ncbi:unnamed protein product, partial [Acidocella sp. C78]
VSSKRQNQISKFTDKYREFAFESVKTSGYMQIEGMVELMAPAIDADTPRISTVAA